MRMLTLFRMIRTFELWKFVMTLNIRVLGSCEKSKLQRTTLVQIKEIHFLRIVCSTQILHLNTLMYEYLLQLSSSLPSGQSLSPLQYNAPGMQLWSLHWNWSSLQVTFPRQSWGSSSPPSGQSRSPSHTQALCTQVMRSLHSNSDDMQGERTFGVAVQPWKVHWFDYFLVLCLLKNAFYYIPAL